MSRRSRRRKRAQQGDRRDGQPHQPDVAEGVVLDAGEEDAEGRTTEESGSQDVEPVVGGLGRWREQAPRQGDDDETDRDVDEEDQPPPEGRAAERDQGAADERPDGGAETDRRTQDAEGAPAVGAAEHLLHQAGRLRVDQAAEQPLQHPRRDQEAGRGGEARERRGDDETADADLEHQPPAVVVAELAAQHGHQPERERVARDDPLQLGGTGARCRHRSTAARRW